MRCHGNGALVRGLICIFFIRQLVFFHHVCVCRNCLTKWKETSSKELSEHLISGASDEIQFPEAPEYRKERGGTHEVKWQLLLNELYLKSFFSLRSGNCFHFFSLVSSCSRASEPLKLDKGL